MSGAADLVGKRVVVTGAGRGIGRALAIRLAAEGARVMVNDLDPGTTREVADQIHGAWWAGDASSEAGVAELVRAAREALGGIDVWFGNAGIERGRTLATAEADWSASWQVNVMAHVRAARELIPEWTAAGSGGRFVVTASAAGLLTMLGSPAYSVTKHGAVAFAEWLSATYRDQGVVVQAICPQGVNTDMLTSSGVEDVLSHDGALEPEDVAQAVIDAWAEERFLILPHPEVADYYRSRAENTDRWLGAMNRMQTSTPSLDGMR